MEHIFDPIKELKIKLYKLLLLKCANLITDSEVNIMYELSKDPDIQEILSKTKE